MSINTIARFLGALVTVIIIAALFFVDRSSLPFNIWWIVGIGFGVALLAFVITPYITVVPYRWMREAAASDLVAAVIGLIVGLIISFLIAIPLANLPGILGRMLPFVGTVVCGGLGVALAVQRKNDLSHLIQAGFATRRTREREREEERQKEKEKENDKEQHASQLQPVTQILLDTSAIIDGRIADISQTGFVSGALLVPRFVLNELQRIADSADTMRRNRGRRGLEMLNRLQKDTTVPIEITDADVVDVAEVDGKLVKMARTLHCPIITNDFNLNRVAELQGVKVLNINELANAVKPVLLPGEDIFIKIMQDGKELGQGVGYLDDGTMIVVEGGRQFMGMTIEVSVTRVLQTVAGRMIFAHPKQGNNGNNSSSLPPTKSR
ncbi:MAG: PIN domain nuclease [Chloroflexi bacterium]|nr:MAG: PIN domain nuclease [Chloroflexota bacterium]